MNTRAGLRHLVWGALVLGASHAQGQASVLGHTGGPLDHLGWDNLTPQALEVRHDGNWPIDWYTDALHRMRLWNTQANTINGYGGILQNGFMGISDQPLFFDPASSIGPFSRLHLVDRTYGSTLATVWAQQLGYRPWMRNGVTFTGNSDQGYVGQKYAVDTTGGLDRDVSDMVLQWSNDGIGENGPDRLRFLFTATKDGSLVGSRSDEGLESFRVHVPNDTSAFVGIGDFYKATVQHGVVEDPTERLHVNDGTVRIDSLVPDYRNDALTRVMMSDANGRVHWRDISTWPQNPSPGAGCDWEVDATVGKVYTAYRGVGTNGSCPESDWKVGIGDVGSPCFRADHNWVFQGHCC